jgi:enamine deaminase RidA (YjgF/YER057c/UK114 family)
VTLPQCCSSIPIITAAGAAGIRNRRTKVHRDKESIMDAEARLKELGIELPPAPSPIGNYVAGVRVGNLLFMSGCGPRSGESKVVTGKLGADLSTEEGYAVAGIVALNMLANIRSVLGSLNRVERVVKVLGMVNSAPTFDQMPKVINGFSDLFVEVFGVERGRGARSAVGMAALPNQIAVEVEMVLQVSD